MKFRRNKNYVEYWSDELQVFHNPNAKRPLNEHVFGGITQHFFKDGQQFSITPDGTVLASRTLIVRIIDDQEEEVTV